MSIPRFGGGVGRVLIEKAVLGCFEFSLKEIFNIVLRIRRLGRRLVFLGAEISGLKGDFSTFLYLNLRFVFYILCTCNE